MSLVHQLLFLAHVFMVGGKAFRARRKGGAKTQSAAAFLTGFTLRLCAAFAPLRETNVCEAKSLEVFTHLVQIRKPLDTGIQNALWVVIWRQLVIEDPNIFQNH